MALCTKIHVCALSLKPLEVSLDMGKGVFRVNANSTDPDQPALIYCLIRLYYTLLCSKVPNDSISGQ